MHHAGRSYDSTFSLLNIDLTELLSNAIVKKYDKPHSKKQEKFIKMCNMEWNGYTIIVGITKIEKKKIQYCITIIQ
jgi:hypothetical protein